MAPYGGLQIRGILPLLRLSVASYLLVSSILAPETVAWAEANPLLSFNPKAPRQSGFNLVFSDDFAADGDLASRAPNSGARWFPMLFFHAQPAGSARATVTAGVLHLRGGAQAATAAPSQSPLGWHGIAFAGSAYYEARIAVKKSSSGREGGAAFWAMAIEHLANRGADHDPVSKDDQQRFVEDDFFEDDTAAWAGPATYGSTIHDWWGRYGITCAPAQYCQATNNGSTRYNNFVIKMDSPIDWARFHVVGQLVVMPTDSQPGLIQNYFDGAATGTPIRWSRGKLPQNPFSPLAAQHLALILGSSSAEGIDVTYVKVWQPAGSEVVRR